MTTVTTCAAELARARADPGGCRRCDLYRNATQTVFGEERASADLMLVGDQSGDAEGAARRDYGECVEGTSRG